MKLALVSIGGALGTIARYAITVFAASTFGTRFPYGTLFVNLAGSFALGFIAVLATVRPSMSEDLRAFLATGVLGGFTTYSAFNQETLALLGHEPRRAALNIAATVCGCLIAGSCGIWAARGMAS